MRGSDRVLLVVLTVTAVLIVVSQLGGALGGRGLLPWILICAALVALGAVWTKALRSRRR